MDLLQEIQWEFNVAPFGKSQKITNLPNEFPAWSVKQREWFGVALPIDESIQFNEDFANVSIYTSDVTISNDDYHVLILACYDYNARNEFSYLCQQFVSPGPDGRDRLELASNPKSWWERWNFLLGNKSGIKKPYDVLGELMVVEYLAKQGLTPNWTGIKSSTHDVELPDCAYEVKSTINRYNYEVTISSIYQLNSELPLYLVFARFEESDHGRSVDDLVNALIKLGFNESELNTVLATKGLGIGRVARSTKYSLLEFKRYLVDSDFPKIVEESFKDDCLPKNIIRMTYTIDLASIECENLLI